MSENADLQKLLDRVRSDTVVTAIPRNLIPPEIVGSFFKYFGRCDYFIVLPFDWLADDRPEKKTQLLIYPQGSDVFRALIGKTREECRQWALDVSET